MEKKTTFISEQEELAYRQMEQKVELETLRYKQDCRKRALEFGLNICNQSGNVLTANTLKQESEIIYKWLISIP